MPRQIFPALFIRGLTSEMLRAVRGSVQYLFSSFFTIDVFAQCAFYIHTDICSIHIKYSYAFPVHGICNSESGVCFIEPGPLTAPTSHQRENDENPSSCHADVVIRWEPQDVFTHDRKFVALEGRRCFCIPCI